jgi:hypothetical protein
MDSNNLIRNRKEKVVEFDMNTIDSALWKVNFRAGISSIDELQENIFTHFINETLSDYGNNKLNKVKRKLKANKNSGFSNNQQILFLVKDLYSDYDIYNNHLTFFLIKVLLVRYQNGIDVYNYVLRDSAYIK